MTTLAFAPAARTSSQPAVLVLENRHTGERLEMRRVRINGEHCLEVGSPDRCQGLDSQAIGRIDSEDLASS